MLAMVHIQATVLRVGQILCVAKRTQIVEECLDARIDRRVVSFPLSWIISALIKGYFCWGARSTIAPSNRDAQAPHQWAQRNK